MRVVTAVAVFLLMSIVVVGIATAAFYAGAAAVGGIVFAVLWAIAAAVLARIAKHGTGFGIGWAVAGLFLGPFPAAWLSWRAAPVVQRRFSGPP